MRNSSIQASRILAAVATIGLFGAASAPALSDDGFMAIHMDNQKATSPVAAYWDVQNMSGTLPTLVPALPENAFMAIHMENQKASSAVSTYWNSIARAINPPEQYGVEAFGGNLQANFEEADGREFPQVIYDKIASKITRQTTFVQPSSDGFVRWSTGTLRLVDFVKTPSPTYADTYLFALRYVVSVFSEMDSLAVHDTSCQVVVVYKHKEWSEPTVACAPVNLNQPNPS